MTKNDAVCICGFAAPYEDHCGKIHRAGAGLGTRAESLMRARHSAYVRCDRRFLMDSWHADTRPQQLEFDPHLEWLGLEIVDTVAGGALDTSGIVEFRARFTRGAEHLELHERSRFERIDGRWMYTEAE